MTKMYVQKLFRKEYYIHFPSSLFPLSLPCWFLKRMICHISWSHVHTASPHFWIHRHRRTLFPWQLKAQKKLFQHLLPLFGLTIIVFFGQSGSKNNYGLKKAFWQPAALNSSCLTISRIKRDLYTWSCTKVSGSWLVFKVCPIPKI